jgi:hypothetical protein
MNFEKRAEALEFQWWMKILMELMENCREIETSQKYKIKHNKNTK